MLIKIWQQIPSSPSPPVIFRILFFPHVMMKITKQTNTEQSSMCNMVEMCLF